ncbi:MAG: hypothetical protein NTW83_13070 [Cyanobacteria bacterium]|nr:hypothetical protein [Cyanobacteriota bacterium]
MGSYDIDIDTFFFLGWKLTQGSLLYTEHFDSKWPIVQYLFVPSALLGSIRSHRMLVFLLNAATALVLARSVGSLGRCGWIAAAPRFPLPWVAAALYLLLSQKLVGGLSGHIHHYANTFLVLALACLSREVARRADQRTPPRAARGWLVAAGFWLFLAAAVRPNLIVPLLLTTLAGQLWRFVSGRRNGPATDALAMECLAMAGGGLLGALLTFGPYAFVPDGPSRAWAGAVAVLLEWSGQAMQDQGTTLHFLRQMSVVGIAGIEVWILMILPLLGLAGWVRWVKGHGSGGRLLLLPLLATLYLLGLAISFEHTHYWGHYDLMSVLPYTLLIVSGIGLLDAQQRQARSQAFSAGIVLVLSLILAYNIVSAEIWSPSAAGQRSSRLAATARLAGEWSLVRNHLAAQPPDRRGFISPQDFSLHWQLHQDASTVGVHPSWSLDPYGLSASWATRRLGLAITDVQACDQLVAAGNHTIVWKATDRGGRHSESFLRHCLATSTSRWTEITARVGLSGENYKLFERQPRSAADTPDQPMPVRQRSSTSAIERI